jgi:hypothetical protein
MQVPATFLADKATAAFFNALLNTIYQMWTNLYGIRTSAKVTTTDATVTGLVRTTVGEGRTVMLVCQIVARRTGGSSGSAGDSAFYTLSGAYKNIGGTLTGVSSPVLTGGEDQSAWNVGFDVVGTETVVTVVGAAGNDITWEGSLSVYSAGA